MHGMLHAALVVSSRPHAKILSVDATAATRVTYMPCLHTCDTALPCAFHIQTPCAAICIAMHRYTLTCLWPMSPCTKCMGLVPYVDAIMQ